MDFTYDDEQDALREAVRGLVRKAYDDYENRRRAVADDPGFGEQTWKQLAEMGVLGLPFSEDDGGSGAGPVEVAIVAEELGRRAAPEPYVASVVLAGGLVQAVGTPEQRGELLGALSAGEKVLALAHAEAGRGWADTAEAVTAAPDGDGWRLDGTKTPVVAGARADVLVVSAALPDGAGTGLFLVDGDAEGLERTSVRTPDGGRAADITFSGTPAVALGEAGADRAASIAVVTDIARIVACHEALGLMATAIETTADYLKSRKQFGVTLNTFQALTFRAADLYVALELARSTVLWAGLVLAEGGPEEVADAAARAALQISSAGRLIGQEAIQLHGGIGMTAEYSIGAYTSRLLALESWLGDGQHHLARLAAVVGDHGALDPLR